MYINNTAYLTFFKFYSAEFTDFDVFREKHGKNKIFDVSTITFSRYNNLNISKHFTC